MSSRLAIARLSMNSMPFMYASQVEPLGISGAEGVTPGLSGTVAGTMERFPRKRRSAFFASKFGFDSSSAQLSSPGVSPSTASAPRTERVSSIEGCCSAVQSAMLFSHVTS